MLLEALALLELRAHKVLKESLKLSVRRVRKGLLEAMALLELRARKALKESLELLVHKALKG